MVQTRVIVEGSVSVVKGKDAPEITYEAIAGFVAGPVTSGP